MPYGGVNDPTLPGYIADLPDSRIEQWIAIFNSSYESCRDAGGDNCEARAFQAANGTVLGGQKQNEPTNGVTNFPQPGDDLKPSIRNSEYEQFDRAWAEQLREDYPQIWRAGGTTRGNEAYDLWGRWREGDDAQAVIDWLYEREDWFARHFEDAQQFVDDPGVAPTLSNVAGIVSWIKWGGVGQLGESRMKEVINALEARLDDEKARAKGDLRKTGEYRNLPKFERKRIPMFVKRVDAEEGIVEHVIAVMGNLDSGDDIIDPGAFSKTVVENGRRVRVLDNHQTDSALRVVGKPLILREISRVELPQKVIDYAPDATGGLLAITQYAMDTGAGRDMFHLVKGGFVPETSIGYDALNVEFRDVERDGRRVKARVLKEIRLWEYSNVIWGMNEATATLSAKSKITKQKEEKMEIKGPATFEDLPLSDRDYDWNSDEAEARVRAWAGGAGNLDEMDWDMYSRAFLWFDDEAPENVTSYSLPFADILNGELTAVYRGLAAAAARLNQTDIPAADREQVAQVITSYYEKAAEVYDDESIVSPLIESATASAPDEGKQRRRCMGDMMGARVHQVYSNMADDWLYEGRIDRSDHAMLMRLLDMMMGILHDGMPKAMHEDMTDGAMGYGGDLPGLMSLRHAIDRKAGRAISKANAEQIIGAMDMVENALEALEELLMQAGVIGDDDGDDVDDVTPPPEEQMRSDAGRAADKAPTKAEQDRLELLEKLNSLT